MKPKSTLKYQKQISDYKYINNRDNQKCRRKDDFNCADKGTEH